MARISNFHEAGRFHGSSLTHHVSQDSQAMTDSPTAARPRLRSSIPVLIVVGCAISALNGGPPSTMGFFLTPMTSENGWGRQGFAPAIAIPKLAQGAAPAVR